eukprot:1328067-Prymnesium_polylepis.2
MVKRFGALHVKSRSLRSRAPLKRSKVMYHCEKWGLGRSPSQPCAAGDFLNFRCSLFAFLTKKRAVSVLQSSVSFHAFHTVLNTRRSQNVHHLSSASTSSEQQEH